MKYYCYFRNGLADTTWQKEDEDSHPPYIPNGEAVEITLDQMDNQHMLIIEEGVAKFDPVKLAKKEARDLKRTSQAASKASFKAMSNADINGWNVPEMRVALKALLDIVADRNELTDNPL